MAALRAGQRSPRVEADDEQRDHREGTAVEPRSRRNGVPAGGGRMARGSWASALFGRPHRRCLVVRQRRRLAQPGRAPSGRAAADARSRRRGALPIWHHLRIPGGQAGAPGADLAGDLAAVAEGVHLALIEHQDLVGHAENAETLGDDDDRRAAPAHLPGWRCRSASSPSGVEAGIGLVEHDQAAAARTAPAPGRAAGAGRRTGACRLRRYRSRSRAAAA